MLSPSELSLDPETVAAQCAEAKPARDPWLVRRDHTWGASDVPALLLAYDPRPEEVATARAYHRDEAEHGRHGMPRIVARKAGLTAGKRASNAMQLGTDREEELLALWASRAGMERVYQPEPRCCLPYVDRLCSVLAVTPDHFAIDDFGLDVTVEAKCSFDRADRGPHWFWAAQVQAQIATCAVSYGVVVVGPGWARDADMRDAPVVHVVMPDTQEQARIRRVCLRAWEDVLRAIERKVS